MTEQQRRCATCAHWQREGAVIAAAQRDPATQPDVGTCQIDPPILAPSTYFAVAVFPQTHAGRFCGSWEQREAVTGGNIIHLRAGEDLPHDAA